MPAKQRHLSIALSLLSLAVSAGVPRAWADPFGTDNDGVGPFADTYLHTYCWDVNFNEGLKDNATAAMNKALDAQTVMVDQYEVNCDGETDIRWFDATLDGNVRGTYRCVTYAASGICAAAYIHLDPLELNEGANDEYDTTKTACHEVGHSVGLQHGDAKSDCMRNGEIPDTSVQWRRYSSHHVEHIDGYYG